MTSVGAEAQPEAKAPIKMRTAAVRRTSGTITG
jgi:hypothetical protein